MTLRRRSRSLPFRELWFPKSGNCYLAGIDVSSCGFGESRIRSDSHDPIFTVQIDLDTLGKAGRNKGRNTNTEVNVHAVMNFHGCSLCNFQTNRVGVLILFGVAHRPKYYFPIFEVILANEDLDFRLSFHN
jgi:hypothetical protein